MRRIFFLLFGLAFLLAPEPLWAGAYEQLLSISGGSANIPDVPEPTPVEEYNSSSYQQQNYNYVDPQEEANRAWRREQRKKAAEVRRRDRARRAREARWRREDREWAEERKERQEYQKQLDIVRKQLPPSWKLKSSQNSNPATEKAPPLSGLSSLIDVQKEIDVLQEKGQLDQQQQKKLAELDKKMFELWQQMVSADDTPAKLRRVLRLPVGLAQSHAVPELTQDRLREMLQLPDNSPVTELAKDAVPIKNGLVNFAGDYLHNLLSQAPAEVFEAVTDEELGGLLKNGIAIAKIGMAFRDKAKGIAAVIDFAVGRIKCPQANIAAAGRKIYTNVAFEALHNFMEKSSSAIGLEYNRTESMEQLKKESSLGQRAFIEWLGAK